MTQQVQVSVKDENYTVDVEDVGSMRKAHFAAQAPNELIEMANAETIDEAEALSSDLSTDTIEYLAMVTTEATEFTEDQLSTLPHEAMLNLMAAVLAAVFDEYEPEFKDRRLRRVRATKEFIECLFTGDMAMVGGMPDDASLENFDFDPSRNELQFIFSSGEWEKIDEGAEIPLHEAYSVGRCVNIDG